MRLADAKLHPAKRKNSSIGGIKFGPRTLFVVIFTFSAILMVNISWSLMRREPYRRSAEFPLPEEDEIESEFEDDSAPGNTISHRTDSTLNTLPAVTTVEPRYSAAPNQITAEDKIYLMLHLSRIVRGQDTPLSRGPPGTTLFYSNDRAVGSQIRQIWAAPIPKKPSSDGLIDR